MFVIWLILIVFSRSVWHGESRKEGVRYLEPGLEALDQVIKSNFWNWDDVSIIFFWRWPKVIAKE